MKVRGRKVKRRKSSGVLRIDPSRTSLLRENLRGELRRRVARLKARLLHLVETEDAFGLNLLHGMQTHNIRFAFHSLADKVSAFRSWLLANARELILAGAVVTAPIEAAFKRGLARAYADVSKPALAVNPDAYSGGKDQFLRQALATAGPKIRLLSDRATADLEGVISALVTTATRTLGDGLLRGDGPRQLSEALLGDVDRIGLRRALAVANGEVVRGQAEGQLEGYEALGVGEVGVTAEFNPSWQTAGDAKVCAACRAMEGIVLPVADAHGMIPRHSECRCAFVGVPQAPTPPATVKRAIARSLAANPTWPGVANALTPELVEFSQFLTGRSLTGSSDGQ